MHREQLTSAIENQQPFSVRMADGREYPVPHPDYISLPPKGAYVIIFDDQGRYYHLPFRTMTGIVVGNPGEISG